MDSLCVAEWFLSGYEPVPFQCPSVQHQATVILLVKLLSEHFSEMKTPRC